MTAETIKKFFREELEPATRQKMKRWIRGRAAGWLKRYVSEKMDGPGIPTSPETKQVMFARVMAAIAAQQQQPTRSLPANTRLFRYIPPGWSVAAAACLVLLAGILVFRQQAGRQPAAPLLGWQTIRNDSNGRMKRVMLPDSSWVLLNAQSSISFSSVYNQVQREVRLTGEAFFDVAHQAGKPFLVQAGEAHIRVYGTAFNIKSGPQYRQLSVALQRGKLGVWHDGDTAHRETILAPGQVFLWDRARQTGSVEQQPVADMGGWTSGRMVFFKTPMKDVLLDIARAYGVHFVRNHLPELPALTSSFDHASLQQVLRHLSFIWNIHYTQKADTIYLFP